MTNVGSFRAPAATTELQGEDDELAVGRLSELRMGALLPAVRPAALGGATSKQKPRGHQCSPRVHGRWPRPRCAHLAGRHQRREQEAGR